jgi:hypothetical protein
VGGVDTKTVTGLFIALFIPIYLLQTMAIFKIKLEDKAAFLNRMEKAGTELNTDQTVDNKLEGYFEVTIDEPKQLEAAKLILKQSPKINTIKEMENKKKMTKDELKEMVRQELQGVLAKKKKAIDENEEMKDEKKVTISLNEYIGDSSSYDLGVWAAENFPAIWQQFKAMSTTGDLGQQYVDFGTMFVVLCTTGTIAVSVGLAVVKDQIVDAAKKIKNAAKSLFGGKMAEAEGVDPELEQALNDLPQDVLAKLAK